MSAAANRMAAKVAETATKAAGRATQSGSSTGGAQKGKQSVLQKGAKRDPELYVWIDKCIAAVQANNLGSRRFFSRS